MRSSPQGNKFSILSGSFVLTAFLTAIGLAVLVVIASITWEAMKNKGLVPPPSTLDQYECASTPTPLTLLYRQGTDRVTVKSLSGILEGTVKRNQFDWASFSGDSTMLGFLPPTEITSEESQSVRISGPGYTDVICTKDVARSGQRKAISP